MRGRHQRPIWPGSGRFMGNTRMVTESMEQRLEVRSIVPVEPGFSRRVAFFPVVNLCPVRAVQCAVLNRLAEMARLNVFRGVKVSDRTGHLQNAVVGSRRKA